MRTSQLLAVAAPLLWILAVPDSQQTPTTAEWTVLTARLEKAALDEDAAALRNARERVSPFIAIPVAGVPVPLARYAAGYADFRMAVSPLLSDKEQKDVVEDAIDQLAKAVTENPKFAEAHALLATMHGLQISHAPELAMALGTQSDAEMAHATGLEPTNPRVLVLDAIGRFNTPPEYGGSISAAETILRRALSLFDREAVGKPWPNWGRFDAHAWLGQALADRHDVAAARAEYESALKLAPNSKWVRLELLPQLGKGAAASRGW